VSGPATPCPVSPSVVAAARVAVLESLCTSGGTDSLDAARRALQGLTAHDLLDAAALLAVTAGRRDVFLLVDEWHLLAAALGLDP
jgi:hypothetical protein